MTGIIGDAVCNALGGDVMGLDFDSHHYELAQMGFKMLLETPAMANSQVYDRHPICSANFSHTAQPFLPLPLHYKCYLLISVD